MRASLHQSLYVVWDHLGNILYCSLADAFMPKSLGLRRL